MEIVIIARFHARKGEEAAVADRLMKRAPKVRAQPGCLSMEVLRSIRDARLFYVHSCWTDEAAFEAYGVLPETDCFVDEMQALIDHPFEASRLEPIA